MLTCLVGGTEIRRLFRGLCDSFGSTLNSAWHIIADRFAKTRVGCLFGQGFFFFLSATQYFLTGANFSLPPPPQFVKHIPDCFVAQMSVGFSKSKLHLFLILLPLTESLLIPCLLISTLFRLQIPLILLRKGRNGQQNEQQCSHFVSCQTCTPSPFFPVVSVMRPDYKWMNIFRLRFHEPRH